MPARWSIASSTLIGEAAHHLVERLQRLLGHLLVAADIGDLDVVAERLEVIGVGGVAIAGMELDETVGGDDRLVVFLRLVERVGAHHLRLGRPHRIGMLAVDFLEALGGLLVFLAAQRIEGAVVEDFHGLLDIVGIVVRRAAAGEPECRDTKCEPGQCAANPAGNRFRHTLPVNPLCPRVYITPRRKKEGPHRPLQ